MPKKAKRTKKKRENKEKIEQENNLQRQKSEKMEQKEEKEKESEGPPISKESIGGLESPEMPCDPLPSFCCPIGLTLMEDPVILKSGQTYERGAIQNWFQKENTDPLTREKLEIDDRRFIQNTALKNAMDEQRKERGFFTEEIARLKRTIEQFQQSERAHRENEKKRDLERHELKMRLAQTEKEKKAYEKSSCEVITGLQKQLKEVNGRLAALSLKGPKTGAETKDATQEAVEEKEVRPRRVSEKEVKEPLEYASNFEKKKKLAEEGNIEAQVFLARSYLYGLDTKKNQVEANKWVSHIAKAGRDGQERLWAMQFASFFLGKEKISFHFYNATDVYPPTQCTLGICRMNGQEGVKKEEWAAIDWLEKAAVQGDVFAQYYCGYLYANGKEIMPSPRRAFIWLQKAAEQDLAEAQYQLALYYQRVHKEWLDAMDAAQKGDMGAKGCLEGGYFSGIPEIVYDQAKCAEEIEKWFRAAAKQGHAGAQRLLSTSDYRPIKYAR